MTRAFRNLKIISTAKYLPARKVTSIELDSIFGTSPGQVEKASGVCVRHYVGEETAPTMGARVAREALAQAGLSLKDIDALVCTSGTPSQPIPSNASLILEAMGEMDCGITSFDINSTCLSFIAGLDIISCALELKRFKRVLFVTSEAGSVGLNFKEMESASLMGDGAVAILVERNSEAKSKILSSELATYPAGARFAEIRGGGTNNHAVRGKSAVEEEFFFHMEGPKIFRLASKVLPAFLDKLFSGTGMTLSEMDLVIPHQASGGALNYLQRQLGLPPERMLNFIHDHGNTIAASIPMGIHNAIVSGRLKREDKVLLIGTGAGLTIGGAVLTF